MNDKATIVVLSGDFDVRRRDELDQILDRYGDAPDLVLDVTSVQSVDTSTLRSLVRFQRARREAGRGPITLAGANEAIRRLIDLAQLPETFATTDEA